MKKHLIVPGAIAILLISVFFVAAKVEKFPAKTIPSGREVMVPQKAIEHSQALIENRLIVPKTAIFDQDQITKYGCEVIHTLKDIIALRCPPGIQIENSRQDRIFYLHDFNADVQINADDVWNLGYNGSGVKVAILDTGVDATHIELADSVLATKNFVAGRELDTDGHGTHVSGIVTADGDYELNPGTPYSNRATGVAPGADIIVGKVCGNVFCRESDIMAGIEWAVAEGADILSLSLGGGNFNGHCDSDPLAAKVNWAVSQGLVAVVSAGNEGAGVSSPACASKAIAVGAVNQTDGRPSWSNYGDALDIVAPGVVIFSTFSCAAAGDCSSYWYAWLSGTSMSAPHVSGVAALLLQKKPGASVDEVKEALYKTALDLGAPEWDQFYGWGRVDALAAVEHLEECSSHDISIIQLFNLAGNIVTFYNTAKTRDNIRAELVESTPTGTSSVNCAITTTSCSVMPQPVQVCIAATDCAYPTPKTDTTYQFKLIDEDCMAANDSFEII